MFWKKFPKLKPKNDGWYTCTVSFQFFNGCWQSYVIDLYWYGDKITVKEDGKITAGRMYLTNTL